MLLPLWFYKPIYKLNSFNSAHIMFTTQLLDWRISMNHIAIPFFHTPHWPWHWYIILSFHLFSVLCRCIECCYSVFVAFFIFFHIFATFRLQTKLIAWIWHSLFGFVCRLACFCYSLYAYFRIIFFAIRISKTQTL